MPARRLDGDKPAPDRAAHATGRGERRKGSAVAWHLGLGLGLRGSKIGKNVAKFCNFWGSRRVPGDLVLLFLNFRALQRTCILQDLRDFKMSERLHHLPLISAQRC